ncbi:MAG: DUF2304 domain-containing protein [Gemmataceae bacterium]|nr:DUF2304 domain-containing protein [Gemmataceae bacterium]MDW8266941.1 DUF2304 domain-containing protein [Gemmataceae bacterium]
MNAESLMLLGGIAAFVLTIWWVRSRDLREKYAIVWIMVASLLLVCGLFPDLVKGFAERVHLSYAAAVLYVALVAIYLFSFTVSLSLSRQHHRNVRLTQQVALLEHRLQQLEATVAQAALPRPAIRADENS